MATYIEVNTTDYVNVFTIKTNALETVTGYKEAHIPYDEIVDVALLAGGTAVKIVRKFQRELHISVELQAVYLIVETIDGVVPTSNQDMMDIILTKIWG